MPLALDPQSRIAWQFALSRCGPRPRKANASSSLKVRTCCWVVVSSVFWDCPIERVGSLSGEHMSGQVFVHLVAFFVW